MDKWRMGTFTVLPTEKDPVPIIADAAIASSVMGDGKFIPVLILDTSRRPDIEELVKFHDSISSGDVKCTWGSSEWNNIKKYYLNFTKVSLILEFQRPSKINVILEFDISKQGTVVDTILRSNAVYLQPGRKGDRFIYDVDKPKILAEIPDTGIGDFWDKAWQKALIKRFKKSGLNRTAATEAAKEAIEQTRKTLAHRVPR